VATCEVPRAGPHGIGPGSSPPYCFADDGPAAGGHTGGSPRSSCSTHIPPSGAERGPHRSNEAANAGLIFSLRGRSTKRHGSRRGPGLFFSESAIAGLFPRSRILLGGGVPIDHIPPRGDVIGATILIFQIIGMLPDVHP